MMMMVTRQATPMMFKRILSTDFISSLLTTATLWLKNHQLILTSITYQVSQKLMNQSSAYWLFVILWILRNCLFHCNNRLKSTYYWSNFSPILRSNKSAAVCSCLFSTIISYHQIFFEISISKKKKKQVRFDLRFVL